MMLLNGCPTTRDGTDEDGSQCFFSFVLSSSGIRKDRGMRGVCLLPRTTIGMCLL